MPPCPRKAVGMALTICFYVLDHMILPIAQLGQPILWQKAPEMSREEIATPAFQQFIADMRETLEESGGVGLAAPQVFQSRRVFLAAILASATLEQPPGIEVFINPRIVQQSQETTWRWEGCLSFSELMVFVERATQVTIEYLDLRGQPRAMELRDLPARIIQHEYDHLDGVLTLDRAQSSRHIIKASEYATVLKNME